MIANRKTESIKPILQLYSRIVFYSTKQKKKQKKTCLISIRNRFLFFILKNKKQDVFREHFLIGFFFIVFTFFLIFFNKYTNM